MLLLITHYLALSAGFAGSEYVSQRLDGATRKEATLLAGQAFAMWPWAVLNYARGVH